MKPYQITRNIAVLLMMSLFSFTAAQAQANKADKKAEKAAAMKAMVEAQQYVFHAQNTNPMQGRNIQLTSGYAVKVGKDTVVSDLPYFGRAYTAPMDPTKGGIQFTSTKFEYELKEIKKGWQVQLKPKDASGVQQFYLSIFDNGTASLQVTSTNRQPISFTGYVSEKK